MPSQMQRARATSRPLQMPLVEELVPNMMLVRPEPTREFRLAVHAFLQTPPKRENPDDMWARRKVFAASLPHHLNKKDECYDL